MMRRKFHGFSDRRKSSASPTVARPALHKDLHQVPIQRRAANAERRGPCFAIRDFRLAKAAHDRLAGTRSCARNRAAQHVRAPSRRDPAIKHSTRSQRWGPHLIDFDWTQGELAEALRRYEAGEFFAAHEAWENAWLRSQEPEKTFLQGHTAAHHQLAAGAAAHTALAPARTRRPAVPRRRSRNLATSTRYRTMKSSACGAQPSPRHTIRAVGNLLVLVA
jgi:hypothetical protein